MAGKQARPRMVATGSRHRVTPAELFFDLVFVYAITQVTALIAAEPSALRLLGAMVVLALLWWCWCCFAWLGNVSRADTGLLLTVLFTVMAVVLVVSLAVPEVYAEAPGGLNMPLVFVLGYGTVRLLHLAAYWVSDPGDRALHATLRRTVLLSVAPPFVLLLVGSLFTGLRQGLVWLVAVVVDYFGIYLTGASGWRVASPAHFAERHGLIIIIALGESIVAIGVGVSGSPVSGQVLLAAVVGLLISIGFWLLYFRAVAGPVEHRLSALDGAERTVLARDVFTYLHLPLVAGVVLVAFGVKKALEQVADATGHGLAEPLHGLVAWALPGGVALFLLAAAAILRRSSGRTPVVLVLGGAGFLLVGSAVAVIPALLSLAALAAAVLGVVLLHLRVDRKAVAATT
jgi:low temperature requirement protein LtrA